MTEREIFLEALEMSTPEARADYLQAACGGDVVLRCKVDELLKEHFSNDSLLAGCALEVDRPGIGESPVVEAPATMVGRYKLLEKVGEGGFGEVWMAEQREPVKRRVALKIIKPGMDSRQVVARFEAERQALAMMDHANIAKIFDAGVTETGRPYFVMELVRGMKFTEYCDEKQLPTEERLKLFILVCQAIQHAHQKGIIHRDIKPSNILVTQHDGVPVPKVIDFGIAKATQQELTDKTLFTQFQQFIGTPAYISPEQAEMSGLDIDTRADIYSLGVLLYELLIGQTPFDAKEMIQGGLDALRRIIREEEPLRPSTKLNTLQGDARTTAGKRRQTEVEKLVHQLQGDLDWIVMKCLEKDRARRYETANGLAMDLERYLADEPVIARPPSTAYRLQKFVRRNQGPVLAAVAVLVVLSAGMVGTGWGLVRTERAREREAQRADGEQKAKGHALAAAAAERAAKLIAQAREAETMAVLDFVENKVFAAARPAGQDDGLGHDISLRQAMEAALPFIETTLTNQPLIEARLRMTIGWSFWCVGEATNAAEQFQAARWLYTQHLGTNHPDTLRSMNNLANSYGDLGRQAEALKLYQETLELRKATLGPEHPDTLITMNNVAFGFANAQRFDEAIQLAQEALTLRSKTLGPDHPHTLMSRMVLTRSYAFAGRLAESVQFGEETLALQRAKLGPYHPYTLRTMYLLGNSYFRLGRQADALKIREEAMPLMQARIGRDNPVTLWSMGALAKSYTVAGRYADAMRLLEEMLPLQKAKLGANHADTIKSMQDLAWLLASCPDVKLRDSGRAVELAKSVAEQKPAEIQSWRTLTVAQYRAGNYGAVLDALNESMKIRGGRDRIDFLYLAMSHWQLGNKDEARRQYDQAVTGMSSSDLANETLTVLRHEAAGLLGVAEK